MLDKKSYWNILTSNVFYKILKDGKYFHIILNKVDGYIKKNDSTKYLALPHSDKKHDKIIYY